MTSQRIGRVSAGASRGRRTGRRGRHVQLHRVDLLEPGDQVEVQQPGDAEPDEAGAVGVDEVLLDLHVRAVPHRSLDHRVNLGGGAADQLAVHGHRPGHVDRPVDQDTAPGPAVARVPLGVDVLVEGGEVGGVRCDRGRPLAPQRGLPGGEGGVSYDPGGLPGGLDGEVAAPRVPQVVLSVRVVAGGGRADPGPGAVGVDQQQEPLEQHLRVQVVLGPGRGEDVQAAGAQAGLGEHVHQRDHAPPGPDRRLHPAQVPRLRRGVQRREVDRPGVAALGDLQPGQALPAERVVQR